VQGFAEVVELFGRKRAEAAAGTVLCLVGSWEAVQAAVAEELGC